MTSDPAWFCPGVDLSALSVETGVSLNHWEKQDEETQHRLSDRYGNALLLRQKRRFMAMMDSDCTGKVELFPVKPVRSSSYDAV